MDQGDDRGEEPRDEKGEEEMAIGYMVVEVLPELKGKPWCAVTRAYASMLRPSEIRVTSGEVKNNFRDWRVTVWLDARGRVERCEQEVEVELSAGVNSGHELRVALDRL